ncbi:hypothetical protein [Streptomyces sp. NTH33]|uniref:hypothetical protein n=1 Tax=Streptomyces sp. NTH33 TaxID=1735453 RepID=UPI0021AC721D|nr:hypothetical protein [Streptomyces sp. NTH33]
MVERFLGELEADGVGRGNQVNIFRVLKAVLRDAYGKGAMADDPVKGVQEPEYVREKVVIPPLAYVKKALTVADDDLAFEIVMMVGCGLRNGEARAVDINKGPRLCQADPVPAPMHTSEEEWAGRGKARTPTSTSLEPLAPAPAARTPLSRSAAGR